MVVDIVCGMKVDEKVAASSIYKGKVYYFCNPSCKLAFEKNPKSFIK